MFAMKKLLLYAIAFSICLKYSFALNGGSLKIHRTINPLLPVLPQKPTGQSDSEIDQAEEEEYGDGFLDRFIQKSNKAWLFSLPAALLVGATGIFPLIIFPAPTPGKQLKEGISENTLKLLLGFAVGGLLGDVFLHLLPETWIQIAAGNERAHVYMGLWVIGGLLSFLILEKVMADLEEVQHSDVQEDEKEHPALILQPESTSKMNVNNGKNGHSNGNGIANGKSNGSTHTNGHSSHDHSEVSAVAVGSPGQAAASADTSSVQDVRKRITTIGTAQEPGDLSDSDDETVTKHGKDIATTRIKAVGYLNLLANCIDNFTHGLAVAGSFIVSPQVGICTTIAILLHEIPHEIGDFAILLKSGFNRWDAARGQMLTASGALIGALFGLLADGAGDASAWVLPFTSGGFIYIAMSTIVPELLQETSTRESMKQMVSLFLGIACMAGVSLIQH